MIFSNNTSVRNKCLFWGGILLIWAGVIAGILWSKGYQHPSIRKVTEDEIVRIAVYRAMQMVEADPSQIVSSPSPDLLPTSASIIPYRDVDHFLSENPNCCQVINGYGGEKYVKVSGKIIYRDIAGQIYVSNAVLPLTNQYFPANLYYMP